MVDGEKTESDPDSKESVSGNNMAIAYICKVIDLMCHVDISLYGFFIIRKDWKSPELTSTSSWPSGFENLYISDTVL